MSTAFKVSLTAVAVLGGLVAAFQLTQVPEGDQVRWLPRCTLHHLTGLHCPGCGNTRATQALLRGDLYGAIQQNVAFVIALPFLLFGAGRLWCSWVFPGSLKPLPFSWKYGYSVALITLVVIFGVVRNIPRKPFSWLAPAPLRPDRDEVQRLPVPETGRPGPR
ncbi:MAG: DUF2752 domain-containing protein [Verrucomicrobiales bacterium]|nr:DUF2752 domain-containing protein [Verrucomicrobiales bacterium]